MFKYQEKLSFMALFRDYEMTAQEYINFCKHFMIRLQAYDERFKTIYSWGLTAKKSGYIKEDLSDFDEVVFKQLSRSIAYINPDSDNKKLTLQSRNRVSFMHSFSNTNKSKDKISVSISGGVCSHAAISYTGLGGIYFNYSNDLQEQLTLSELLDRLEFTVSVVPLLYSSIGYISFSNIVNELDIDKKLDEIKINWITYTNRIETAEVLPDYVSYKKLPTGVIFWLSESKITADDTEYVEKAIEVRNILAKHDLLKYNQH